MSKLGSVTCRLSFHTLQEPFNQNELFIGFYSKPYILLKIDQNNVYTPFLHPDF